MSYGYDDEYQALFEERILSDIDDMFKETTSFILKKHLNDYMTKILCAKEDARKQKEQNNLKISLVLNVVSIEIFIRQLVIKPLAQGAFYYEEWAELLASKIGTGNAGKDREIISKVLKTINFDISKIKIEKIDFIECFKYIADLRNKIMHEYIEVTMIDVEKSESCVKILFDNLLPYLLDYYKIKNDER